MITNSKKWHYLAVKNLSRLLSGITSNHHGNFYCLNCFHSYSTETRVTNHERVYNDHDYCHVEMPNEDNKISKHNCRETSLKIQFEIDLDVECILKKEHPCQNNFEKSYTERKAKHEPSGWEMTMKCSFDATKNKYDYYRKRDCIKKLCKNLRDCTMKINNYEEKEMTPLTDEESRSYEMQRTCHLCKKEFCTDENEKNEFKLHHNVGDHCYYTGNFRGAAHNVCNFKIQSTQRNSSSNS